MLNAKRLVLLDGSDHLLRAPRWRRLWVGPIAEAEADLYRDLDVFRPPSRLPHRGLKLRHHRLEGFRREGKWRTVVAGACHAAPGGGAMSGDQDRQVRPLYRLGAEVGILKPVKMPLKRRWLLCP
jgi:hypothetical protein